MWAAILSASEIEIVVWFLFLFIAFLELMIWHGVDRFKGHAARIDSKKSWEMFLVQKFRLKAFKSLASAPCQLLTHAPLDEWSGITGKACDLSD
jgi:hypothetical protein